MFNYISDNEKNRLKMKIFDSNIQAYSFVKEKFGINLEKYPSSLKYKVKKQLGSFMVEYLITQYFEELNLRINYTEVDCLNND